MKKKLTALLLSAAMTVVLLTGCGAEEETPAGETGTAAEGVEASEEETEAIAGETESGDEGWLIGYTAKSATNDPFQQYLGDAITAYVERTGNKCVWVQTDTGNADTAQQASQIEDLIAMGCDAVVVNPCDQSTIIASLETLKEEGIPVVVIDTGVAPDTDPGLYITSVATDNYAAAMKAGECVKEALGGEGHGIIVSGLDGNQVTKDRYEGFLAGLEGSNITIDAVQNGEYNNDKAMQVAENLLQAHADADFIYTVSDCMLDGIMQAIDNHGGVNPDILLMSYDGSAAATEYVIEGKVLGTVAQFPVVIGETAAGILIDVLNGDAEISDWDDRKFTDGGSQAITAENAEEWLANGAY